MGKHSGAPAPTPARGELTRYGAAALATAIAWGVLVFYAIRLGHGARAGQATAWVLMLIATVGAVGCLFLALVFCGKLLDLVRGEPGPVAVPGGRRARR